MSPLEIKKIIFEIQRVTTAKMEMDLKISEREDEIIRLRGHMEAQDKRIAELKVQLEGAGVTPPA